MAVGIAHHRHCGTNAEDKFRFTVMAALKQLPDRVLSELAMRWPVEGNPAERIVARAIDGARLDAQC